MGAAGIERASNSREPTRKAAKGREEGDTKSPVHDDSQEADLARAVRLAAEAGEWIVVTELSRQLEAIRRAREGAGLRLIKGVPPRR